VSDLTFSERRDLATKLCAEAETFLCAGKSAEDTAFILSIGHGPKLTDAEAADIAQEATDAAADIVNRRNQKEKALSDPLEASRIGRPFAMTDLGNAERLVARYGHEIRWDMARKCWRTWDGARWSADSAMNIGMLAAQTARSIREESAVAPPSPGEGQDVGLLLFRHAVKSEARARLEAMVELAKAQQGIAVKANLWDCNPWQLNCLNGTIDLRTGELQPHNRGDLITKLCPVNYDPAAKCARWRKFLDDATDGNVEKLAFLQRAAGYTLTGDTSEEVFFFVHGPEAACKSTFLEALRAVLGDYARTIQTDVLIKKPAANGGNASPEIAALAEARWQAKASKNWAEADRIRALLQAVGIVLEDTPKDTLWRRE
jgi:phage/plasmid-associated DNA primase